MPTRIDKKKKFKDYKWNIIELLHRVNNINLEQQLSIKECSKRDDVVKYIIDNLDSDCKRTLKKYKIKPFYKGESYTKIIVTPMGNKR